MGVILCTLEREEGATCALYTYIIFKGEVTIFAYV